MSAATHYPADAWGGVQADGYYGGGTPQSALHPSYAEPVQAQWDDTEIPHELYCASKVKKTGDQCQAFRVKGDIHCTFHRRQMERLQAKAEAEAEASDDGSEP